MSLTSFLGKYQVVRTYGTQFGIDTRVTIDSGGEGGAARVTFEPPGQGPQTHDAVFEETTESLRIELSAPAQAMHISRYQDPQVGYRSIYAAVILEDGRLALWSAELLTSPEAGEVTADPVSDSAFSSSYRVTASAAAQFGLGSTLTVGEPGADGSRLTIEDLLGQEVPSPDLHLDPATCSMKGLLEGFPLPIVIQLSVAGNTQKGVAESKIVYGVAVFGDPEQGGLFGAEDQGTPPTQIKDA